MGDLAFLCENLCCHLIQFEFENRDGHVEIRNVD